MYCPVCDCEFDGWKKRCPVCRGPLSEESRVARSTAAQGLVYEELVDAIGAGGGSLDVEVRAREVGMEREQRFPYRGYGFAWVKRMLGGLDAIVVDLRCTEVGKECKGFLYFGFGYAWVQRLEGAVAGNPVVLSSTQVRRKRSASFPYRGYGFAWTTHFSGHCGPELQAELRVVEVGRHLAWSFPYFGYGNAWEKRALLTLASGPIPGRS